jgi:tetratricopeptide (TPR) repeat protein
MDTFLSRLAPATMPQSPPNPEVVASHQRGRDLQLQGDVAAAEQAYRQVLALDPLYRRSLNNLAVLLLQRFEPHQAEALLERGLESRGRTPADPAETALLLNTLCQLRLHQQRPQEAVAVARRLVQLAPQPAHFTNLAVALQLSGQPRAAVRAQRQALGLGSADPLQLLWQPLHDPQSSAQRQRELQNLATMELALDPFDQQGWRLLQARLAAQPGHWASQPSPWQGLWGGERVGELLLWDEQGFGDAIQCLRWLPAVVQRADRVRLWLRPQLLLLVQRRLPLPAHVEVLAWPEGAEPWCQRVPHLPLMSLPLALGLSGLALAAGLPLKCACNAAQPRALRRLGMVWAAGRKADPEADRQARQRSLPLAELMTLLEPAVLQGRLQLVSLQVGPDAREAAAFEPLLEPAPPLDDWEATACALEQLDGVISVDTAVAHLAGSIGVPTLLLLPQPCDWRWGLEGERTPWYPSVRSCRGVDREAVLQQLREALSL